VLVVEELRSSSFRIGSKDLSNAYFVSNTRVVDRLRDTGLPITMKPGAVLQWLSTVTPSAPSELSSLTSGILWELSERGYNIVDTKMLQQTFSPLINAAKEQLAEQKERLSALEANEYGAAAEEAFSNADDVDFAIGSHILLVQKAETLKQRLDVATEAKVKAERTARLSEDERSDYLRLKAKGKARREKAIKKKRRALSNPKRKK
jgi:hypothetical protein